MLDLAVLMHECAPSVAPRLLQAIIRTESGSDPLALHINGNVRLKSAPKTAAEAAAWSAWLISRGFSVDMGLMQINSRNLAPLNLTPANAFDPCQNIRAGAAILTAQYGRATRIHGVGTQALAAAISAYNTGNFEGGFRNGYVAKVAMNATDMHLAEALDLTCLINGCSPRPTNRGRRVLQAATADTAITGFDVSH